MPTISAVRPIPSKYPILTLDTTESAIDRSPSIIDTAGKKQSTTDKDQQKSKSKLSARLDDGSDGNGRKIADRIQVSSVYPAERNH